MKRLLALTSLLMLVACSAFAQPNVTIGGRKPSSPGTWIQLRILDDGTLVTMDSQGPAQTFNYKPSQISATFVNTVDGQTTVGTFENRDSTTVIDTRGYNRIAFLGFPSASPTSGDSLMGALMALQLRSHFSFQADSQSTYRNVTRSWRGTSDARAVNDTVGTFAGMVRYSATSPSLLTTALPDEDVVVIETVSGPNRGFIIWSGRINEPGASNSSPFISARLRALNSYTNVTGVPTVPAVPLPYKLRVDVVMWRE